jgi:hypothetical protein
MPILFSFTDITPTPTMAFAEMFQAQLQLGDYEYHPISYGIVPWVHVSGEWYAILQVSRNNDVKVDPFRGQQEAGESAFETAARETFEESSWLLDFRTADESKFLLPKDDTLFHVRLKTDCSMRALVHCYRDNNAILMDKLRGEARCAVSEVFGIALVPADAAQRRAFTRSTGIRVAAQPARMFDGLPFGLKELQEVALVSVPGEHGTVRFVPEDARPEEIAPGECVFASTVPIPRPRPLKATFHLEGDQHVAHIQADASVLGRVIGKQGATRKRVEAETQATIICPQNCREGPCVIVVQAATRASVEACVDALQPYV